MTNTEDIRETIISALSQPTASPVEGDEPQPEDADVHRVPFRSLTAEEEAADSASAWPETPGTFPYPEPQPEGGER